VLVFDTFIRSMLLEIELSKNEAIEYAHVLEEKVTQRTKELSELSRKDELTNLYNRRAFFEFLRNYLANAKRQDTPISLVYFDVDKFKEINDTLGHHQGDEVLVAVGATLDEICREGDVPARYGGDEFCVILYDTGLDQAKQFCDRLIAVFSKKASVTLSIGIAQVDDREDLDIDTFVSFADQAMYQAKQMPGHSVVCYEAVADV
jgi:diguanylate cyclase